MAQERLPAVNIAEQLMLLRKDYLARLPADFIALETLATRLQGREGDRSNLEELHHRLHKLSGSGGTFGLDALSAAAHKLEQQVKLWLDSPAIEVGMQVYLNFVAEVSALGSLTLDSVTPKANMISTRDVPARGTILNIWLVEDDLLLGQELVRQLESFNYVVRQFSRIDAAERAAKTEQPHMLIMDVMFEEEGKNATDELPHCPNLSGLSCPLMFISSLDDFQSRVRASKLGAVGYFIKPLEVPSLVNRMMDIFEHMRAQPKRVLIIDDDMDLAAHYRLVLLGAGMEVEILGKAETLIETISAFRPELVLMDMHMPGYSGPELAGVIRQYDKWGSLTIVYLSAETDLVRQIEALNRGADDFLTKPISDAHLIAAVHVRIDRARHLEGQITRDSLTGLLKHASIKEAVALEVIRSRRNGKPASVAMLDIDHFKVVNDTYGHAVGDVVISSVAMLLRQRLRQSDIIGRYGGEEFAAVLQSCDQQAAYLLLDDIRQRFANLRFSHEGKDFTCAISVGLACTEQFPNSNGAELLIAADEALYAAKRGGRNQVKMAPVEQTRKESAA